MDRDSQTSAGPAPPTQPIDFSLVGGGPLYRLLRRTRLSGDALELAHRRVFAALLLAWLPLLFLSIVEGRAWGGSAALPFLLDVETHVRMLVAVPLLLLAEGKVHRELRLIVQGFVQRGLVPEAKRSQFDAAIASAMRWRDSTAAELLLLVFVYFVGVLVVRRTQFTLEMSAWYATAENGQLRLTWAGWWTALVSLPLFQFLMVRWYYRFFVWARFLWQVSRIDLDLEPTHPDCAAGLQFVAAAERACRPVLLALGAVLAGMMANRIFHTGAVLLDFKVEIVGTVAMLMLTVLAPMLVFTPQLRTARQRGLAQYGSLGQRYARGFGRRWMRGEETGGDPLLGSADIQSLADLRSGYLVVRDIQLAPFNMRNIVTLAVTTLLPVAPLLLTTFSVEELIDRMLKTFL